MRHSVTVNRAVRPRPELAAARQHRGIVALLLPLVALGWAVARLDAPAPRAISAMRLWAMGPVYSVAEVERQMAQTPGGWVGRTVLVQGRAATYRTWSPPDSIVTRIVLVDPGRSAGTMPLSLQWGGADPLLASLRRLPVVGLFAPPPQRPHWGTTGIYRIQLCCLPSRSTDSADAVLLDADLGY
jgi:hypothetical protein